jgi:hypothetical protein
LKSRKLTEERHTTSADKSSQRADSTRSSDLDLAPHLDCDLPLPSPRPAGSQEADNERRDRKRRQTTSSRKSERREKSEQRLRSLSGETDGGAHNEQRRREAQQQSRQTSNKQEKPGLRGLSSFSFNSFNSSLPSTSSSPPALRYPRSTNSPPQLFAIRGPPTLRPSPSLSAAAVTSCHPSTSAVDAQTWQFNLLLSNLLSA